MEGGAADEPPSEYCGRTALQAAAEGGHKEVVQMLLAAHAEANALASKDSGRTALQAAAGGGHKEIVEVFLATGADIMRHRQNTLAGQHYKQRRKVGIKRSSRCY